MSGMRSEDGFTLMEVVTALAVGFVVLAATLGLIESSVRLNSGVMAKTDAMQRGRLAMDQITQQLRSQVCLNLDESAVVAGSDSSGVTFYADNTADGLRPVKRRLEFEVDKSAIRSAVYEPTVANPLPGNYPSAPTRRNLELENAVLQKDTMGKDVPFLRYYAYTLLDGRPQAEEPLSTPLTKAQAARVARVDIAFLALPTGSTDRSRGVNLTDQIVARHSNPNLEVPDPNCV